jgi:hypothetical protein
MMKSLRVKIFFCSACSAVLHFLLLEQFTVGQAQSARPVAELPDLKIRYIPSYFSSPAVEITPKKLPAKEPVMPKVVVPVQPTVAIEREVSEPALPANESIVVENFYESAEVDEPASPESEWPIVVEGMTRGLTFNVQMSVWVSSLGRIERVDVIQVEPESEKVRLSLQSMLGATVRPAVRAGANVANKRNLEFWLTQ